MKWSIRTNLGLQQENKFLRLARATKRVALYPIKFILSRIYTPQSVLREDSSQSAEIFCFDIGENSYVAAKVNKGRLFTNRISNITVISEKCLVPFVSWQYSDGSILPDTENFVLDKKILIQHYPQYIEGTVISLLTGGGGNYNYYHWLFDCLPRLHLAEKIIQLDKTAKYLIPEDTHPFQDETLEVLGICADSRISSKDCQHLQASTLIATSHPNPDHSKIPEWIVSFLRESFLGLVSLKYEKKLVYISRGDSVNSRRILNEKNLANIFELAGFGIYQLSELTFADQVSLFSQAKMVVGAHGAGFANLAFASPGTVIYELFSDQYQPNMYERLSLLAKLDYYKITCESIGTADCAQQADFQVSDNSINTILAHAEKIVVGDTLPHT